MQPIKIFSPLDRNLAVRTAKLHPRALVRVETNANSIFIEGFLHVEQNSSFNLALSSGFLNRAMRSTVDSFSCIHTLME